MAEISFFYRVAEFTPRDRVRNTQSQRELTVKLLAPLFQKALVEMDQVIDQGVFLAPSTENFLGISN